MRYNKLNLSSHTIKAVMSDQDVPEPLVSRACIICLEDVPDKDTGPAMMHCPRCTGVWCVSHYEQMSKEESAVPPCSGQRRGIPWTFFKRHTTMP